MERSEITALIKSNFLFRQYPEEKLDLIVDQFNVCNYDKGKLIFEQNGPAEHLFMVYSGNISLSRTNGRGVVPMGVLQSGDLFGYEMLEYGNKYQTSAAAETNCTILWLDQEHTLILLQNLPTLDQDLKFLYEGYSSSLQIMLPWREPDEVVYFLSRRHVLDLARRFLPWIAWSIFSFIALGLLIGFVPGAVSPWILTGADALAIMIWFVLNIVEWANDYSIVTNRRVVFQEKVIMLYDSRHESPLRMVLSVAVQTGWVSRRFAFGDVLIRTYAGQILFPKVVNARQVAALIEVQAERAKSGLVVVERSNLEELVRETIGLQEKKGAYTENANTVQANVKSGRLITGLSEVFRLRKEQNGVITYWTHWIILLKRIWLPTTIFLFLMTAFLTRMLGMYDSLSLGAVGAIMLVSALAVAAWWVYQYQDWRNDQYVITQDQVIDVYKKPLGVEERRAAPLKSILSIEFKRLGLLGLLLNFGTVYIKVGETTLTFDHVFNPSDVQRELFSRLAARDESQKKQERMAAQRNMANWIEAYHKVTAEERSDPFSSEIEGN